MQGAVTLSSRNALFAKDGSPETVLQCVCYLQYGFALSDGENVCEPHARMGVAVASSYRKVQGKGR